MRPGYAAAGWLGRDVRRPAAAARSSAHARVPGAAAPRCRREGRPAVSTARRRTTATSPADVVAGLLAVGSIVLSGIAMGFGLILEVDARPARTSFVAIVLALVSARLSARYQSLALKAVLFAMVAWVVGMTLAVITENPLI